jgi:FkbM family methyltransferase
VDLMTSRPAMLMRGIARRMHVDFKAINSLMGNGKEEAFSKGLAAAPRSGDVAWDVGAFRGWYTMTLSKAVGPEGRVFSLEPNPQNRALLLEKTAERPNVTVLPVALGAADQVVSFVQRGARSQVVSGAAADDVCEVRMASGDALIASGEALQPAVLKIDAEGLEFDVLNGMLQALASPRLRAIFMEVHFKLLEQRHGATDVPARIVAMLKGHGFRTKWLGPSHLAAHRSDA